MKVSIYVLLVALAAPAAARQSDADAWARAIVESPHFRTDDGGARVAAWLDLIEREPGHPLVEITLRLIDATAVSDPSPLEQRILALDPARMTPASASVLVAMQGRLRSLALSQGTERTEAFPDRLTRGLAIGPLADRYDARARADLLTDPGFDVDHRGLWGRSVRWQPMERPVSSPSFDLDQELASADGWALAAFAFALPGGGPGWLELDFGDAAGPGWVSILSARENGFRSVIADPSCQLSINADAPIAIDFLASERSDKVLQPVVWRDGRNQVVLALNLGARVRFSVRLLDAEGRPDKRATESAAFGVLGRAIGGTPPAAKPIDAASYLETLSQRSAAAEALLGVVQISDRRFAQGIAHLQAAVAADAKSIGARMFLAEAYNRASYLPDTWRRSRARELIEQILAEDPAHLRMQIAHARILAPEDREEEAIAKLLALGPAHPTSPDLALELASLYPRLDMEAAMERQLYTARALAPHDPEVLQRFASFWEGAGQPARALDERMQLGPTHWDVGTLQAMASGSAALGRVDEAAATFRKAATYSGRSEDLERLGHYLISIERFDEAEPVFAELSARHLFEPSYELERANIARLRGDERTEIKALRNALDREASNDEARDRLRALGEADPVDRFLREASLKTDEALADFDPTRWSDHVVRAIDSAVVYVFPDGAFEQLGQERDIARDLEGCEALGKQAPQGDMLRIVTIKQDGTEREPVLVDDEYVMPALEPGDAVESISRIRVGAPEDGVVRIPRWSFASTDKPFHVSRYVISLPKSLKLRMVLRNFAGEHVEKEQGDRVVHEFVQRDAARVVPEPVSPPPEWFLPWVEFGQDVPRSSTAAELALDAVVPARVTPEISAAAAKATEGVESEQARAELLYTFVQQALDKRSALARTSATASLLTREGSGTFLYAALLEAAGIEHEVFWSRAIAPDSDPEPDPPFLDASRWENGLYVQVRPKDGAEAWCDLAHKLLPYGQLIASSPRAAVFGTRSHTWGELPDVPLAERPGDRCTVTLKIAADRSAEVEILRELTGNTGYAIKEQLRELPKARTKQFLTSLGAGLVPGLDVTSYEVRGLEDDSPVSFYVKGRHKNLLDDSKGELACKLPFNALQLGGLASGEGERKLPFFFPQSIVTSTRVEVALEPGLKLAQGPQDTREEFGGGNYVLALEDATPQSFTIVRELRLPPQFLQPDQFARLVSFARRVDEAERVRLRFVRE